MPASIIVAPRAADGADLTSPSAVWSTLLSALETQATELMARAEALLSSHPDAPRTLATLHKSGLLEKGVAPLRARAAAMDAGRHAAMGLVNTAVAHAAGAVPSASVAAGAVVQGSFTPPHALYFLLLRAWFASQADGLVTATSGLQQALSRAGTLLTELEAHQRAYMVLFRATDAPKNCPALVASGTEHVARLQQRVLRLLQDLPATAPPAAAPAGEGSFMEMAASVRDAPSGAAAWAALRRTIRSQSTLLQALAREWTAVAAHALGAYGRGAVALLHALPPAALLDSTCGKTAAAAVVQAAHAANLFSEGQCAGAGAGAVLTCLPHLPSSPPSPLHVWGLCTPFACTLPCLLLPYSPFLHFLCTQCLWSW